METRAITNTVHGEIKKVLYTGKVHIIGGREGSAKSEDGRLDIKLSTPGHQAMAQILSNCLPQDGLHVL